MKLAVIEQGQEQRWINVGLGDEMAEVAEFHGGPFGARGLSLVEEGGHGLASLPPQATGYTPQAQSSLSHPPTPVVNL